MGVTQSTKHWLRKFNASDKRLDTTTYMHSLSKALRACTALVPKKEEEKSPNYFSPLESVSARNSSR